MTRAVKKLRGLKGLRNHIKMNFSTRRWLKYFVAKHRPAREETRMPEDERPGEFETPDYAIGRPRWKRLP